MDYKKVIEDSRQESIELLKQLEEALEEDLKEINGSTEEDIDDLIDTLIEVSYEIAKADVQIEVLDDAITKLNQKKRKYQDKLGITLDDILNNLMPDKIYIPIFVQIILNSLAKYGVSNYQEFINRVAIIMFINFLTFKINSDYLTSNYHDKKFRNKVSLINDSLEIQNITKSDLESAKRAYTTEVDAIVKKIFEVAPKEVNGIPFEEYYSRAKKEKGKRYVESLEAEEKAKKKKKKKIVFNKR